MYYELALISIVIAGAYWGWFFLVKQPGGTPTFGAMQLAAAVLAGIGVYAHRSEEPEAWMGIAGAVGLGAGICMLVVGPFARSFARRLAAAERFGAARRMLDLAELLTPGSGVADEKALLGAMTEIREGRIEPSVEALTAAKRQASNDARVAIDERIAMLYLAAYRWDDAIAHAEEHILGALPELPPAEEGAPARPLRASLGVTPPLWVELLGAYGRVGDHDRAAQMMQRLEEVCAGRPDADVWIHRARLMFLALAGRPSAVAALVEPRQARHMSRAARTYWLGVAHEHHGDRAEATAAYERARDRSRGRPRDMIDRALAHIATADGLPVKLSDEALGIVTRIEAAPLPAPIRVPAPHRPWATWGLTAMMVSAAASITLLLGSTNDVGVLLRSGALVRGLVDGGEWWRLFSCVFVHLGGMHLLVNVFGMWFVGRVAEDLFGTARTLALFFVAGFAGAVGSYLASPSGLAGGSSGALFGLLGAVFVELTWHRAHYRNAWKRGMWGGLAVVLVAVVIVAQIGYGFINPVIDQWAHGAGLVAGCVLALILSPHATWAPVGRQLARVIAAVGLAFVVIAIMRVSSTSVERSLARLPRLRHNVSGIQIAAPAYWQNTGTELAEPDGLVIVSVERTRLVDAALQLPAWQQAIPELVVKRHAMQSAQPTLRRVAVPLDWVGQELLATYTDATEAVQHVRVLAYGRVIDDELVTMITLAPDSMVLAAPRYFVKLYSAVRFPPTPPPAEPEYLPPMDELPPTAPDYLPPSDDAPVPVDAPEDAAKLPTAAP